MASLNPTGLSSKISSSHVRAVECKVEPDGPAIDPFELTTWMVAESDPEISFIYLDNMALWLETGNGKLKGMMTYGRQIFI